MRSHTRKKLSKGEVALIATLVTVTVAESLYFAREAWTGWSAILRNKANLADCAISGACDGYYISDLTHRTDMLMSFVMLPTALAIMLMIGAVVMPLLFVHHDAPSPQPA